MPREANGATTASWDEDCHTVRKPGGAGPSHAMPRWCLSAAQEPGRSPRAQMASTLTSKRTALRSRSSLCTVTNAGWQRTSMLFSSRYSRLLPIVSTALATASTPMDTSAACLPSRMRAARAPATTGGRLCPDTGSSTDSVPGARVMGARVGILAMYSATLARRSLSRKAGWKLRSMPSRSKYWRAMQIDFTAWLMLAAPMHRTQGGDAVSSRAI
mmetsp:Transcript_30661/g.78309  ORF Transcript_30661/g.78309 Transcript_30661/m.78309 type:complete len:215 (+) Transcript_30661:572-1216(+)